MENRENKMHKNNIGHKITFKVYETETGEDVTDKESWFIDCDGDLAYETNDLDCPVHYVTDRYHYEVMFINNQP